MKIPVSTYQRLPEHMKALFSRLPNPSSDEVLAGFPETKSGRLGPGHLDHGKKSGILGSYSGRTIDREFGGDSGSAARFFYAAKSSTRERNEGLPEGMTNMHPTVKNLASMRYLCRLVTPPGGLVLDPFLGSGSTGKAALLEGFQFIGIEADREHGYFPIADARVRHAAATREREDVEPRQALLI
jgi:site-specific DNA-methyltransferase (adenine-specific)